MTSMIRLLTTTSVLMLTMMVPAGVYADCGGQFSKVWKASPTALSPSPTLPQRQVVSWRPMAVAAIENEGDSSRPAIAGLWQVTLVANGTVIDVGFDAWHADGTETLNDVSPISHNVCLGVWVQTGRRTFMLKHPAFRYDAAGNVIGTLVLRETNVVNRAGDGFTGTFTIEFFDLAGASVFQGAGEIYGQRVTVD